MAFNWGDYKKFDTKKEAFATSEGYVWCVDMLESEAGWGSKIDGSFYFTSREEANRFVHEYNKKFNSGTTTQSWYMMAMSPRPV